ncbi:T9SS type A sorting domain-containing protein [bacterium]|nr:T9SS type A sorting domain-containing protein [bacterium]
MKFNLLRMAVLLIMYHSSLLSQPSNKPLYDVTMLSIDTVIVAGREGTLLRTTDGGASWAQTINSAKHFFAVHFIDKQTGWVAGEDGVVRKTTNGGQKWLRLPLNAPELHDVFFVDSQIGWTAGANGFLAKTTDGGEVWQIQNSQTTNSLEGLFFFDADTGWAVGRASTILKTSDGGLNWNIVFTGQSNIFSVYFVDARLGWASGFSTEILFSDDGGRSWSLRSTSLNDPIVGLEIWFANSFNGWVVGGNGGIIATTDGGLTWQHQISPTTQTLRGVNFLDTFNGWAVGGSFDTYDEATMLKTADGGQTWQQVTGQLVGVEEQHENLPLEFNLRQNYPNPFRIEGASVQATTLTYTLSRPAHVSMAIYDVLGRAVAVLVAETKPAGVFQASWNGRDLNQQPVAPGIYLCRIEIAPAGSSQLLVQQRKILVIK